MNTTSRILTIAAALVCTAWWAPVQAQDRGQWVTGPDGQRYYQPALTRVQLPTRQTALQTARKSPADPTAKSDPRVTLVGHRQYSSTPRPTQPLQQLSETRQVGDRIEAAAYVRPLGNTKNEPSREAAPSLAPPLNAAAGEESSSESPSDKVVGDTNSEQAPTLTIPELGDLPRVTADQTLDEGRKLLAEATSQPSTQATAGPSASRIVSTWLPDSEAAPTQWAQTETRLPTTSSPGAMEAPAQISPSTLPQTTAWQGVQAADTVPRLPADSVVPPARTVQPQTMQPPGAFVPPTSAPLAPPMIVRQAPVCNPVTAAPYAPAPVAALPGARPGMTVRRGLLGQPVIHMPGQPLRNIMRFVTP